MQLSQPMPHAVQVIVCLHYGELSVLLDWIRARRFRVAPTKFIFVHKDVWQGDKSVQGERWRATAKLS